MRKNMAPKFYPSGKWILASLVFTVFVSSCSQKMAMVKTMHSQPAFAQVANIQNHYVPTAPLNEVTAKVTLEHQTPQTALLQPIGQGMEKATAENAAKNTRDRFIEKAKSSLGIAKIAKNISTKRALAP